MNLEHKTKQSTFIGLKGSGTPAENQLKLINTYTVKDVGESDVYVRTMYLAHNAVDRDQDKFTKELLNDFSITLPGKGFHVKHPRGYDGDSGPGVGRFFDANVIEMSQAEARKALREPNLQWVGKEKALILEASFYMSRVESTKDLITNIDNGVAGDVSIGFTSTYGDTLRNNETKIAQLLTSPGEALEGSLVWLGAQPGARVVKQASTGQMYLNDGNEETIMGMTTEEQEKYDKALNDLAALTLKFNDLESTSKKKVDGKELFKSFDSLKDLDEKAIANLAIQGQEFKKTLIDNIVSAKRNLKMIGDTDDDTKTAKQSYAEMNIDFLKSELKGFMILQKDAGLSSSQLDGGDPNSNGASKGVSKNQSKDKSFANPTCNPLVTG